MIHETIAELAVPIDSLNPYDRNPRQGDVGAVVISLETNGQYRPIVVSKRDQKILAGNHTWQAAKQLGWTEIAATFVDVDDDQARRIMLVDNRSNDLATMDDSILVELLKEIHAAEGADGLVGTGYDGDDLDNLLGEFNPVGADDQPALGQPRIVKCPECGHEFDPNADG